MEKKKLNKILAKLIIVLVILIIFCAAIIIVREKFRVSIVDIEGNEHYTTREIRDL